MQVQVHLRRLRLGKQCIPKHVEMAQKSKKSKSKRMSLKQKYKIVKKVKEHHKKKAKEEKKLGKRKVPPKDPGIPNQWPFKAELLKELDWEKKRALAQEKLRKEERKRARVHLVDSAAEDLPSQCVVSASCVVTSAYVPP